MRKVLNRFRTTLSFMTRIPLGSGLEPDFTGIVPLLPVAGALIQLVMTGVLFLLNLFLNNMFLVAVFYLFIQYSTCNLFHLDGLLDTCDAFAGKRSREKYMAVLKDSSIGVYALFYGIIYLLLKGYFLYQLLLTETFQFLLLISGGIVVSRTAAAILPWFLKPAKSEGLGVLLTPRVPGIINSVIITVLFFIAVSAYFPAALPAVIISAGFGIMITAILYSVKIGGGTGDAYGFLIEIVELSYLAILFVIAGNREIQDVLFRIFPSAGSGLP